MKYYKGIYSNGYCGCNEDFYFTAENENEADEIFEDGKQLYSFSEPDSRFISLDIEPGEEGYDEAYDEAYEAYQMDIDEYSWFDEITKEEYEEHEGEV